MRVYEPVLAWTLRHKRVVFVTAAAMIAGHHSSLRSPSAPSSCRLSMRAPFFTCPLRCPGSPSPRRKACLQATDLVLKQFPEVDHVLGKAGRAETATDPAPLSMLETLITLKPRSQWRACPHVVFRPGRPNGPRRSSATLLPDTISHRRADRRDALRIRRFPGFPTPGPCRSRAASTC